MRAAMPEYPHLDPRVGAEMQAAMDRLTASWPGISPRKIVVPDRLSGDAKDPNQPMPPEEEATCMGQTNQLTLVMEFPTRLMSSWDTWHKDVLEGIHNGTLHKGISREPVNYTFTHEFGHVLFCDIVGRLGDPHKGKQVEDVLSRLTIQAWNAVSNDTPLPLDGTYAVPLGWMLRFRSFELVDDLSGYAASDPRELVAEGFAIGEMLPGHSKAADAIHAALRSLYVIRRGAIAAA